MTKTAKKVIVDLNEMYTTIDYKDAFNHIRELANLEWNGSITVSYFRERVNDIISVISRKELKVNKERRANEQTARN